MLWTDVREERGERRVTESKLPIVVLWPLLYTPKEDEIPIITLK